MTGWQPNRLAQGGLVDRGRPLDFRFDDRVFTGNAGDTLASALLAAGETLVGRSFKYQRPRGIFGDGPEEPNALVELRTGARREPNARATTVELFAGLEATSQNRFPSLRFDVGAINSLAAPFIPAGFYYKTFMWPKAFWERVYEPLIRRAAGLGNASGEPDPDTYEKAFAFCDVLVIGGGPAGLAAALAAGRAGARVILADEDFRLGGRLNAERYEIDGAPASGWAAKAAAELAGMSKVRVMSRTTIFGVYDSGVYGALERVSDHLLVPPTHQPRQRVWRVAATRAVLGAGAIERPIVFGGNDRPGVMLASAVRTYQNRFAVSPGARALVFTCCDDGWRTAADRLAQGLAVAAVVDTRAQVPPDVRALAGGAPVHLDAVVADVAGGARVRNARVVERGGREATIACDLVALSGGYNPQVALTTHLGGKPRWSDDLAAFVPGDMPRGLAAAGAANGALTLAAALKQGADAGRDAAQAVGREAPAAAAPRASDEPSTLSAFWHVSAARGKAFVDLQNDVTVKDIALGAREGFRSVEHLKRYTTLGMATDQGKTSNVVGLAILAELTERTIAQTGSTRLRPPHTPVAIGALAGAHRAKAFRPTRLTSGHAFATEQGAAFTESGLWLRAQWFALPGEKDWLESCTREVKATRAGVGVCDVSTLGKIALDGADVGRFLDRVYVNTFSTLPVGKARYGLMLREDGFVFDDGTTARLAPESYVLSTTTANAAKTMQHLEFCAQALWPELDVAIHSVTEQWAQYSVAGPRARDLLQKLYGDAVDLSNEAFPFMAARELPLRGAVTRLFRISFSGELAYEIAAPARYGDALIRAIIDAGREFGVTPYGLEALNVMRIEKGHPAGNELNGQTTAGDLGFGRMMSTKKDFIGRVMAGREALVDPGRPALVGIVPVDPKARLRAGAHVLARGAAERPENDEGHVTSVAFSPSLQRWIGLALVERGRERLGERVRAYDSLRNGDVEVEICSPVFVDPEGTRLHG